MEGQRNTAQMKKQTRNIEVQINEEEIGKLPEKEFRIMIVKMIKNLVSTYDGELRDSLWWPQERPVPRRVARGPLGVSLPSMPGPKTWCGVLTYVEIHDRLKIAAAATAKSL